MSMFLIQTGEGSQAESKSQSFTRRKTPRFEFYSPVDWDFFTEGTGVKAGFIKNISKSGCLISTTDFIEHRRWIRFIVKEAKSQLWFTAVGRVIRAEEKLESIGNDGLTFYNYGIEFIHPVNPVVLEKIQAYASECAVCGDRSAPYPDPNVANLYHCLLCHLRLACNGLLEQEQKEDELA